MTINYAYVKILWANYHTFRHKQTIHNKIEEDIDSSWCTFCYTHKRVMNIPTEARERSKQQEQHLVQKIAIHKSKG